MENKKAVVVTTENRGVFFGYVEDDSKCPSEITLSNVRMCVYWNAEVKGVLGLASSGPNKGCRITHSVPSFKAYKVTGVMECNPQATEAWEKSFWS